MKITFIGACHEVTGSCTYLSIGGKHILVDYGMEQGRNYFENVPLPVQESLIDYVFLTHAHVDHAGMLPYLYAQGFRGRVFSTEATFDLCRIMLRDCAHIQLQETEWKNRKAKRSAGQELFTPLFTMEDADGVMKCFVPCHYNQKLLITAGVEIRFTDIGHLLGSSSIEVWLTEEGITKKLVFSGDIGNFNQPLIKNPTYTEEADFVIMESTYGDRYHPKERADYVSALAAIIQEAFDKGGNLVIPSFAVGRTQEILYFIRKIKEQKLIKGHDGFLVYVDSPLAVEATGIFHKNEHTCFDEEAINLVKKGINPISFPGLRLSITSEESKFINFENDPKVIISASGMCEAGRIRHHLKHNLWRKECTVLFVGYQAVGTLGRALYDGIEEVKLFGEVIKVNAKVTKIKGLSGHADKDGLIGWLDGFKEKPEQVFVIHGDEMVSESFVECLNNEHDMNAYAPYSGTRYNLLAGSFEYQAVPIPIAAKSKVAIDIFARLIAAGQRLLAIIKKSEGRANKDITKFTDQINSLCDKHEEKI
ncbi:MAG: MBL fold metallo-hydrolase [Lachnospiraceae bacterium]|nr:MBL fold metallo-hydrolase [Lachnospiraceae bacterium]